MRNFFSIKSLLPLLVAVIFFVGCQPKKVEYFQLQGNAQGTTYSIKYQSDKAQNFQKEVDSLFLMIDESMSTYLPNSLISKINQGENLPIDAHFEEVFNQSMSIFNESNGAFDPSVGPLVKAYGFSKENKIADMSDADLDSLMQLIGLQKVKIINHQIVKENPAIQLDFNAIAQGYTVDVMARFLESRGVQNYMVEIGGEVKAKGVNPHGQFWSIGVQNPEKETGKIETIVHLNNNAVATSGNYRKFKTDENGKKYVHTINPKTGEAKQNNLLSATVLHPTDCSKADAYATTLMVLGFEESLKFLEKHPELKVFLIYVDASGEVKIYNTID